MAIKTKADEVTASDAAVALGVPYHTVVRWVQTRRLKGAKRDGHWYVKVDMVAWARERARAGR